MEFLDQILGNSVRRFQRDFRLSQDGIVGPSTWRALSPYIDGYTMYTIKKGDTLYSISQTFGTTVEAIRAANPSILPDDLSLRVAQIILVPLGSVVPTNISYTYSIFRRNLNSLLRIYPFLQSANIGESVLGNSIPYVKFGNGQKEVFYSASYHANEWITSVLVMKFLEDICKAYVNNTNIYNYSADWIFNNVSLYIVPMVNPDGVNLVTGSYAPSSPNYIRAEEIADNYPDIPFPDGWKANIDGIDTNLQFPAEWERAREIKYSQGFTSPAPRDFVGFGPLTAPESVAVYNFTLEHDFRLIIAYHTQGKEIYWQFMGLEPSEAEQIGEAFSNSSGYLLAEVPFASSFAGFKDWFIQDYRRPGYTIEAGIGTNPLPISQFPTIYQDNLGILVLGAVL